MKFTPKQNIFTLLKHSKLLRLFLKSDFSSLFLRFYNCLETRMMLVFSIYLSLFFYSLGFERQSTPTGNKLRSHVLFYKRASIVAERQRKTVIKKIFRQEERWMKSPQRSFINSLNPTKKFILCFQRLFFCVVLPCFSCLQSFVNIQECQLVMFILGLNRTVGISNTNFWMKFKLKTFLHCKLYYIREISSL